MGKYEISRYSSEEIYQLLKEEILSLHLLPGQKVSENELAHRFNISRTPVRDAVHRLCQESLIDIVPNKGFMLHKLNEQDVRETYDIRSAVEGYCARRAALSHRAPEIQALLEELERSLALQQQIFEEGRDVAAFADEDQRFHRLLVSCSGNSAFIDLFDQYMYRIKKLACYSLKKENRMLETLNEHRQIFEAIAAGSGQAAYDAVLFHMDAPYVANLEAAYSADS